MAAARTQRTVTSEVQQPALGVGRSEPVQHRRRRGRGQTVRVVLRAQQHGRRVVGVADRDRLGTSVRQAQSQSMRADGAYENTASCTAKRPSAL